MIAVKILSRRAGCAVGTFLVGGLGYVLLELLWRGRSHWSMFLVGGACFRIIGRLDELLCRCRRSTRCAACALAVTAVEFCSGCVFNLLLKMNVWDYSRFRFHLLGQVCLLYSVLWGFLSIPACGLYRGCQKWFEHRRVTPS